MGVVVVVAGVDAIGVTEAGADPPPLAHAVISVAVAIAVKSLVWLFNMFTISSISVTRATTFAILDCVSFSVTALYNNNVIC